MRTASISYKVTDLTPPLNHEGNVINRPTAGVRISGCKFTRGHGISIVNGDPQDGHRTGNLSFDRIRLPAKARVEVDQAEDVSFSNIITGGEPPVWKVTRSERVTGVE